MIRERSDWNLNDETAMEEKEHRPGAGVLHPPSSSLSPDGAFSFGRMQFKRLGIFGAVPIRLLQDKRINERDIRVYCSIMSYEGTDDEAYPRIEKIAERAGLSYRTVIRTTNELVEYGWLIKIRRGLQKTNIYRCLVPIIEPEMPACGTSGSDRAVTHQEMPACGTSLKDHSKRPLGKENVAFEYKGSVGKPDVPFAEIIDHLNLKTNPRYRAGSQDTQKHIRARWREGYRLDDFKTVIDEKAAKWGGDPKMSAYLRPSTLFGAKFEGYLNAARRDKAGGAAGKIEFCPRCGAGLLDGKCRDNCGWEAE